VFAFPALPLPPFIVPALPCVFTVPDVFEPGVALLMPPVEPELLLVPDVPLPAAPLAAPPLAPAAPPPAPPPPAANDAVLPRMKAMAVSAHVILRIEHLPKDFNAALPRDEAIKFVCSSEINVGANHWFLILT
jgi:hypothetical protein